MLGWQRRGGRAALALSALVSVLGCSRAPAPPSLVLVVIDSLRADHLGAYGHARAQTPRLDALAARGTRFAAARAPSSWTLPSVASILTGRYPAEHGADRLVSVLGEEHVTVTETLAAAGYETAAFSGNVSLVTPESGFDQGFERFEVLEAPADAKRVNDPVLVRDGTTRRQAAAADTVTDAVLAWKAARRDPARPYFLYVHYFDPHAAYTPPVPYAERFGVKANDPLLAGGQAMVAFGSPPPPAPELATLLALYDAEIAFTDHEIGRLLDGLGNEAIVVVTADHGEEFGDHRGMLHGRTLFEEMIRVPLLVAGADLPPGRVVETPVSLVSVAATLAELAGAPPSPGLAGRSLVSVLRGSTAAADIVFAELAPAHALHRAAAIDGTWKLILDRGFVPALFDLATGPDERTRRQHGVADRLVALQKALGDHTRAGFKARGAAPAQ